MPNLKFLAQTVPEIWKGPKIPKLGHVTLPDPLDLILHFFVSAHRVQSACQM